MSTDSQIVVTRLKTHPKVTNVVTFGSKPQPGTPYVVVKEEQTGLGFRRFRVVSHFDVNNTVFMETYCRKDCYDLLAFQDLTDGNGRRIRLIPQGISGVLPPSDDSTFSQEAVFHLPEIEY